jgi:hypothetical protein
MSTLLQRIMLIADNQGITITSLEKKIGASKGVLSRAYANNTDIMTKWITSIVENYPQYNIRWLLTGKGNMKEVPEEMPSLTEEVQKSYQKEIAYLKKLIEEKDKRLTSYEEQIQLLKDKCAQYVSNKKKPAKPVGYKS